MNSLFRLGLAALAGAIFATPALAGSPVVRTLVRDINGKARVVYVRVADKRIMYPRVIQQVAKPGKKVEYRPAQSSAYRPGFYGGHGLYRPGFYAGHGVYRPGYHGHGQKGAWGYSTANRFPDYWPSGNYGVDGMLNRGNGANHHRPGHQHPGRPGFHKPGRPGVQQPGGAVSRPVVKPYLQGVPPVRHSGKVKGS